MYAVLYQKQGIYAALLYLFWASFLARLRDGYTVKGMARRYGTDRITFLKHLEPSHRHPDGLRWIGELAHAMNVNIGFELVKILK